MNFVANKITSRDETTYNIAYLAFIYILMLSTAAWGIFTFFADEPRKMQIAVFLIFVFIFCDAGVFAVLQFAVRRTAAICVAYDTYCIGGFLIYKRPTIPKIACFFVALYFFAGSKLANVPYSVIVSVLALSFAYLRKGKFYRIGVLICVILAAVCITNLYMSIPSWMHYDTTYQSVFFGAVKESETPERFKTARY